MKKFCRKEVHGGAGKQWDAVWIHSKNEKVGFRVETQMRNSGWGMPGARHTQQQATPPHATPPHAHGRQNGAARAKALRGPPAAGGSAVLRARLAAEEETRRTDNAAIKEAVAKAEGEADKVRHEQRRKLDRDVKNALLRSKRVFGCV
jgi:hypothetical protein